PSPWPAPRGTPGRSPTSRSKTSSTSSNQTPSAEGAHVCAGGAAPIGSAGLQQALQRHPLGGRDPQVVPGLQQDLGGGKGTVMGRIGWDPASSVAGTFVLVGPAADRQQVRGIVGELSPSCLIPLLGSGDPRVIERNHMLSGTWRRLPL